MRAARSEVAVLYSDSLFNSSSTRRFLALPEAEKSSKDVQIGFFHADKTPHCFRFVNSLYFRSPEWEAFENARWLMSKPDWDGERWAIASEVDLIIRFCVQWFCEQGQWKRLIIAPSEMKRELKSRAEVASIQRAVNVAVEKHWKARWEQAR